MTNIMTSIPIPSEEKIFIPGPAGRIEALAYGIGNIDTNNVNNNVKTIGIVCHPHPLFQGTMYNKVVTTICKAWQNIGLPTLRFNFRGVGESEGQYDQSNGECLDLEAVLTFLQQRFPNAKFCLGGFSFGSFIALKVAGEPKDFPIEALLSVAPPVRHFAFDTIAIPECPWVIIQGTEDTLVPYEKVSAWASKIQLEKSNLEFITMKGAEHFFHGQLIELKTIIQNHFQKFKL